MLEKDYKKLIKEYEKLNEARPDIYVLSYDEQIKRFIKIRDSKPIRMNLIKKGRNIFLDIDRMLMDYFAENNF